jgi:Uma2 family endonuclease
MRVVEHLPSPAARHGRPRAARWAYDQGTLEIIMPSDLHEVLNRLLDRIITALTEELDLKIKAYGSTTLEREDLEQGVEPDSCYYIQTPIRSAPYNSTCAPTHPQTLRWK